MKRKMTYLYALGILSLIASLQRVYSTFIYQVPETFEKTGNADLDFIFEEAMKAAKELHVFTSNLPHKILAVILLGMILAVFIFAFKKDSRAPRIYLAYQGVCLLQALYDWFYTRNVIGFVSALIGFAIFFGLAYYFSEVKPKKIQTSIPSSGIDV